MFFGRKGLFRACRPCCFLLFLIWSPLVKWVDVWRSNLYLFLASGLPKHTSVDNASIWVRHSLPLSHRRLNVRTLRSSLSVGIRPYISRMLLLHVCVADRRLFCDLSFPTYMNCLLGLQYSSGIILVEGSNVCVAHFDLLYHLKIFQWIKHWLPQH